MKCVLSGWGILEKMIDTGVTRKLLFNLKRLAKQNTKYKLNPEPPGINLKQRERFLA
jgi:hypothetical protein